MKWAPVLSGIPAFDQVIQKLRLGDNVVWHVDSLADYTYFARALVTQATAESIPCVYLRFAPHEAIINEVAGVSVHCIDPTTGFDTFTRAVHQLLARYGKRVYYIFDNLSSLVTPWATDELVASFFQVTCPYLRELETVAYFALSRTKHEYRAVGRIRDTTQLFLDLFTVNQTTYLHPIKVWDRYSSTMFLPHTISTSSWEPINHSGAATTIARIARRQPLLLRGRSIAPWDSVYETLIKYRQDDKAGSDTELAQLQQELSGMLLGNHPKISQLAKQYLSLDLLLETRDRVIGTGQIGGKAAGMLLARQILLQTETKQTDFRQVLDDHDSFYIGSDVFFSFLVCNKLYRLKNTFSIRGSITKQEFAQVEQQFLGGTFDPIITEQLQELLDYFGQAPIIVRSSSLLEDSFGNSFAGKYRSEFCPNQGTPQMRLENLLHAVKLVYASTLNPDAIAYRSQRNLINRDEQMAILVQRVAGSPYKQYFFPSGAGVAFSRNLYSWTNRIDPLKGLVRLVFGLGTRAVDRVGGDFPRMFAVSNPTIRPESMDKVSKYSQHEVDVLDLQENKLTSLPFTQLMQKRDYPNLHRFVSLWKYDYLEDRSGWFCLDPKQKVLVTFNDLIQQTALVSILDDMLTSLEQAYGLPVDTEFTISLTESGHPRVNLVQCRPMWLPQHTSDIHIKTDISANRVLFRSDKAIRGGVASPIRYLLYIDPRRYRDVPLTRKQSLGHVVGVVNKACKQADEKLVLLGPGRWGSSNIALGVNVSYADINNAAVLVEIGLAEAGHVPELSYGTHFFQDLVEAEIIYLPLYPHEPSHYFNTAFFESAHNVLADQCPEVASYQDVAWLVDLSLECRSGYATLAADPVSRMALCYLEE